MLAGVTGRPSSLSTEPKRPPPYQRIRKMAIHESVADRADSILRVSEQRHVEGAEAMTGEGGRGLTSPLACGAGVAGRPGGPLLVRIGQRCQAAQGQEARRRGEGGRRMTRTAGPSYGGASSADALWVHVGVRAW